MLSPLKVSTMICVYRSFEKKIVHFTFKEDNVMSFDKLQTIQNKDLLPILLM